MVQTTTPTQTTTDKPAVTTEVPAASTQVTKTESFVTAQPTDVLSSKVVGMDISNVQNEDIGEIKDVIISDGKLAGYVVSVGGVLCVGERYVVVAPSAIQINYAEDDKKWTAIVNATQDQLTAAPEFKYEGRWGD